MPKPPPNPEDEPLRITMGHEPVSDEAEIPIIEEPPEVPHAMRSDFSGTTTADARPHQDDDPRAGDGGEIESGGVTGHYDAWVGKVWEVNYASGEAGTGRLGVISVVRVAIDQAEGLNYPVGYELAPAHGQRTPMLVQAMQFPLRHDQPKYHVAVGDYVTVLEGRDGRHWFLADELPFIGEVIDNTEEGDTEPDTTEQYNGGAGNVSLCVWLQSITGDPSGDNWTGATLASALDGDFNQVAFTGVKALVPTHSHHGWRVGDKVIVSRRGKYFFCCSAPPVMICDIVKNGPDGEAALTNNYYWLREIDGSTTYDDNTYTISFGDRPRAVTGQTGFSARHVVGVDLAQPNPLPADQDRLSDDGTQQVIVFLRADPSTKEPFYVFERQFDENTPTPKTAILRIRDGFYALFCMEAGEYRFYEHMTVHHFADESRHQIDPMWLACVEAESVHVVSAVPEEPLKHPIAASICGEELVLRTYGPIQKPVIVRVLISGFVRGHEGERFPARTEEQYKANIHLWRDWFHQQE